ncbi:hypothetical protein [Anaerocolumna chitinilytica]|uniref:Uncharacterized protein n=1 Tax=Anaerocolumna chitinilytica TaxID=1727145 RepID=A0A7M3S9Y7_9FIRM|nr:hypothetical protein [Anaerocolumna chitinilytica]BCK01405.1 hypothetical protein bsdcttw_44450 [Anaerocolumna chitinilytica]
MSDRTAEKLVEKIKGLHKSDSNIFIGVMKAGNGCNVNGFNLDAEDLLLSEHLKTGYQGASEYIEPLKSGDTVLVLKIDNLFIVTERLVTG